MADVLGKKISELAETTDLAGLYTIGSDKNNQSKKVSLQFVKEASDYANAQGDYAKTVGDTVQGNTGVDEYPVFSASKQYAAGDVVLYDGRLYEFIAGHAAGAWVGTDVKETSFKSLTESKIKKVTDSIDNNGLIGGKKANAAVGDLATENGHLYEYKSNAKVYDKKYKAVIGAVGANEFLFQQGYRYEMLDKVEGGNALGVVEFIPVAFEKAIFGKLDENGNRLAEKYELSLYFNESDRIANSNQQIAFFDANKTHIVSTWYFGLSQPSDDKKYSCALTILTPEQALEEAQDATRIYKFTINLAKTTNGASTWGIDANGNLYGTLADVKYIGYSIVYSTARTHSIMLNNDYSVVGDGWERKDTTVNGLAASKENLGKVKMWVSVEDGEQVLNISTEL